MNILPPEVYVIGKITSKHGYRGTLHIKWDDEDLIPSEGDYLFVLINQKGVPFLIEKMNTTGELVDLAYIDHENKAIELIGMEVGIDAAEVPENKMQILFEGFTLIDANSDFQGVIQEISTYPGQIMLHVVCENQEFLIPYVEDWMIETQIKERTLVVKLPDGLVHLYND